MSSLSIENLVKVYQKLVNNDDVFQRHYLLNTMGHFNSKYGITDLGRVEWK